MVNVRGKIIKKCNYHLSSRDLNNAFKFALRFRFFSWEPDTIAFNLSEQNKERFG